MSEHSARVAPGFSHHIFLEGHNHQAVFNQLADYQFYLVEAGGLARAHGIRIQGWCLLPWRLHLLMHCPEDDRESFAKFMRSLGSRYTRYYHEHYGGTGTVWKHRYRCSVVQPGQWQLAMLRYLETLPVILGLTTRPQVYKASSYLARIGRADDQLLSPDPDFLSLGSTDAERRAAYREFLSLGCDAPERALIEAAMTRECVTGDDHFADRMAGDFGILKRNRGPGRPPKR